MTYKNSVVFFLAVTDGVKYVKVEFACDDLAIALVDVPSATECKCDDCHR